MIDAKQFYPTPTIIAREMWRMVQMPENHRVVLEPSAGKGNIADIVHNHRCKLYVIELHPDLRATLIGKSYRLVGDDFLQYQNKHGINCILMNPPFEQGADHLLHAWKILDYGEIVCILNAETIRNPYTAKRKLLAQIIAQNGTVQFRESAFSDAERKTDVEIAIVHLQKSEKESAFYFDFERRTTAKILDFDEVLTSGEIMQVDQVDLTVSYFDEALQALAGLVKAMDAFKNACSGLVMPENVSAIIRSLTDSQRNVAYANGYDDLTKAAWKRVFTETNIASKVGSKFVKDFNQSMDKAGLVEFTRQNIIGLYQSIASGYVEVQMQNVVDVFDTLTSYDKRNCIHPEGWVTNSAFKVNKKFILPGIVSDSGNLSYYCRDVLRDIEKAMCYVAGIPFVNDDYDKTLEGQLVKVLQARYFTNPYPVDTKYFTIKLYMKGTAHFVFKDEFIWQRFNELVCKGKNWIPESVNDRKETKRKKK